MPLLDHFRPPLYPQRHWDSFHSSWANAIQIHLNGVLPDRYFAEVQVTLGTQVEVDVATLDSISDPAAHEQGNGGVAVAAQVYAPPVAALRLPAVFPDDIGVRVFGGDRGSGLVAAVELVSPGNKDRPEYRRAFAAKCVSYLAAGIGLIIVDVVTTRLHNLHDEIVSLMQLPGAMKYPHETDLYAVAYRPLREDGVNHIDAWPADLAVGAPLVTLPLAVRGLGCLPLDLDATYTQARHVSRLG